MATTSSSESLNEPTPAVALTSDVGSLVEHNSAITTASGSESPDGRTPAVATASGSGSQSGHASLTNDIESRTNNGKRLNEGRYPSTASRMKYTTRSYPPYQRNKHSHLIRPPKPSLKMKDMAGYPLWMEPFDDPQLISTACRLDDLTIAKLIDHGIPAKTLNERWPVEFDLKGNVRVARMPLGFAAKMWVSKGQEDRHGKIATGADEGWYYRWHRGVHLLCGDESLDKYRHRVFLEEGEPKTWYFDLECKCYIQDFERSEEEAALMVEQRRVVRGDVDEDLEESVDECVERER